MRPLPSPTTSDAGSLAAGVGAGAVTAVASFVGLASLTDVIPVALVVAVVLAAAMRVLRAVRAAEQRSARETKQLRGALKAIAAQVHEVRGVAAFSALDVPFPLPLGGWALNYDAAAVLAREVVLAGPETVVELGAGASSLVIGLQLRRAGRGHLHTFDHDAGFANTTRSYVEAMGLGPWITVHDTPLARQRFGDEDFLWYTMPPEVAALDRVDFLVVDGPPLAIDREGMPRYPALPAFAGQLGPGSIVFVDDALRDAETRMLQRWATEEPGMAQQVLRDSAVAILRRQA